MGWGSYYSFGPYVSKAEKIKRAAKAISRLSRKKGFVVEPVSIEGSVISKSWWSKSWSKNIERYADYAYRLERGRSYVRCGSVIDLKIEQNVVRALVMGSDSEPYKISVTIAPLSKESKTDLADKCRKSLDSVQTLLSGEFPEELKEEFFKKGSGLFPAPSEIRFDCSCPDIANMCKHVAAAIYGISARLDTKPEHFFTLRGLNIDEFIGTAIKEESQKVIAKAKVKSDRVLVADDSDLSALFGIEIDQKDNPAGKEKNAAKKKIVKTKVKKSTSVSVKTVKAAAKKVKKAVKTKAKSTKPAVTKKSRVK